MKRGITNMEVLKTDVKKVITTAASDIFAKFGFKKTTMDEIAEAAHKAKSSIYYYFKSKEEIFRRIIEKESEILKEEINRAINQEKTPQKRLRAYTITRTRGLNRLANFYSALKDEYFEHYAFIEKIRKEYDKDELRVIKEILKNGVDDGTFSIKDLDVTAFVLITALKGLEYTWAVEADMSKIEKNIDNLLEVLFNGIAKK